MGDEAGILRGGAYIGSADGEGGAIGAPLFSCICCLVFFCKIVGCLDSQKIGIVQKCAGYVLNCLGFGTNLRIGYVLL